MVVHHRDNAPPAELTILGVYCRPDEEESSSSDEEEQEKEEKKETLDPRVARANKTMVRRRMKIRSVQDNGEEEGDGYETAVFVPKDGLTASMFYHNDLDDHSDSESESSDDSDEQKYPEYELNKEDRIYEERTVCLQAYEHYEYLARDHRSASLFDSLRKAGDPSRELDEESVLEHPRFGEQLIVRGLDARQICVGDVFAASSGNNKNQGTGGGGGGLVLEITSPRLACIEVDRKSRSPFGNKGLKRHTNTLGLAGWFARVVQAGEAREGTKLRRTSHPHPKWTIAEVSKALYGECDARNHSLGCAQWNRSREELEEFCAIEQLGWMEWKDEARYILDRWEKIQAEKKKEEEEEEEEEDEEEEDEEEESKEELVAVPAIEEKRQERALSKTFLGSNLALFGVGLVLALLSLIIGKPS